MKKIGQILNEYEELGHSKQHKENVDITRKFLEIASGKSLSEEKVTENADEMRDMIKDYSRLVLAVGKIHKEILKLQRVPKSYRDDVMGSKIDELAVTVRGYKEDMLGIIDDIQDNIDDMEESAPLKESVEEDAADELIKQVGILKKKGIEPIVLRALEMLADGLYNEDFEIDELWGEAKAMQKRGREGRELRMSRDNGWYIMTVKEVIEKFK